MIGTIVSIWLVVMGAIGAGVVIYAVVTWPFRMLANVGSSGWSDREPIIIFSRKTWSWLVPAWRR